MAEVQSLRTHLLTELRDLLDAEQQLTTVLRDFSQRAATPALRTAFAHHLEETKGQISRLQQAFDAVGEPAQPKRCEGMHGLIREGAAVLSGTPNGPLRDAIMITSAQKVEHYEIASYGTARTYAEVLGQAEVARLLDETLQEEKSADAKLTEIAEATVNEKAAEEWHRQEAGLLDRTAAVAGQALGTGARAIKRATDAVGAAKNQRSEFGSVAPHVAAAATRAFDAARGTLSDAANAVAPQARRVTQRVAQASRAVSARPAAAKGRQSMGKSSPKRPKAKGR